MVSLDEARVGTNHLVWEKIGQNGVGKINNNGLRLLSLCTEQNLVSTNTILQMKYKLTPPLKALAPTGLCCWSMLRTDAMSSPLELCAELNVGPMVSSKLRTSIHPCHPRTAPSKKPNCAELNHPPTRVDLRLLLAGKLDQIPEEVFDWPMLCDAHL